VAAVRLKYSSRTGAVVIFSRHAETDASRGEGRKAGPHTLRTPLGPAARIARREEITTELAPREGTTDEIATGAVTGPSTVGEE